MTPQPSALAALKRYEPAMFKFADGLKEGMAERDDGDYYLVSDVEKLVAAWPTQARGEAVAFRKRYSDGTFTAWMDIALWSPGDKVAEYAYTHPLTSAAADDPNTCVLCKCRLPDAALREALSMLRECVEGEFGLQAWVDTYPCDHTPKLIESARTLLAGDK